MFGSNNGNVDQRCKKNGKNRDENDMMDR